MAREIDIGTLSYEELRGLAHDCFEAGQWANATQVFNEILKVDPMNRDLLQGLADCHVNQRQYEKAFKCLQQALLYGNTVSSIYNQLGIISIQHLGNLDLALTFFLFASSLNPVDPTIRGNLQQATSMTGKEEVRLLFLPDYRIGHLALEPGLWLRKIQKGEVPRDRVHYIAIQSGQPANQTLIDLYRPHLNIVRQDVLHGVFLKRPQLLEEKYYEPFPYNLINMGRNLPCQMGEIYTNDLFRGTRSPLAFDEEGEARGREGLRALGIDPDRDWYVTVFARDDAYLEARCPRANWSHHQFRNCDITTYHDAIRWIVEQGGHVVRLGSETNQELGLDLERVVDYPVTHRPDLDGDFLDVYLAMNARYMVGQYSGITDVAMSTDVPTLVVNTAPAIPPYNLDNLYIPKQMVEIDTGNPVSFAELYAELDGLEDDQQARLFCCDANQLAREGFTYRDNTAGEILAATREMHARVTGTHEPSPADRALQEAYHSLFPQSHWLHRNRTPIATDFLRAHSEQFTSPIPVGSS